MFDTKKDKHHVNILLSDRSHLTARQSMEAIISYARQEDEKILDAILRKAKANRIVRFFVLFPPLLYLSYNVVLGYWRNIYPENSILNHPIEGPCNNLREYMLPQIYLAEREKRKLDVELKTNPELRELFKK